MCLKEPGICHGQTRSPVRLAYQVFLGSRTWLRDSWRPPILITAGGADHRPYGVSVTDGGGNLLQDDHSNTFTTGISVGTRVE